MNESFGKLVLRLTVGGLLLLHGIHKIVYGIAPIEHMIAMHGLPPVLAYAAYIGEVMAPILVILGLFARTGGLFIVITMTVAVLLTGSGRFLALNKMGGYALEVEAFYLFSGLAIMFLGAGRLSLGGDRRWD